MTSEPKETEEEPTRGSQGESGDSNTTCMICMEEWTIGSVHRVCCLKCGHLFGRNCIERWIKEKGSSASCPTCNKHAKKGDIRDIWCKSIRASDTTELCELKQILEHERKLRKSDAAIIFHNNLKMDMLHKDLDKLKQDIIKRDNKIAKLENIIRCYNKLRAQNKLDTSIEIPPDLQIEIDDGTEGDEVCEIHVQQLKGMFHYAHKVESSSSGGCRSLTVCPTSCQVIVAQPAPTDSRNPFGRFGLMKYSTLDSNIKEFLPLHSKMITSMQLKPLGDLILSSSLDKKVRLTSITNNTCIQSYDCQSDPLCVAWSAHRDQQFYVASSVCHVALYDMRNTSEYIYQTTQRVARTRILSIAATTHPDENLSGLLVNDARGSQFLELSNSSGYDLESIDRSEEHLKAHQLPFEGSMGTVDFDKNLGLALVTTRRSQNGSSHNLLKLNRVVDPEDSVSRIECSRVVSFAGGSPGELLGQSRILKHPTLSDNVLVGACDNDARGIKLWDASDNSVYQTIKTDLFIRDMVLYSPENSTQHVLYALSDKDLRIFRWDYA